MKKAFTLIELLVVVLIIGILSAVALPQYQKSVNKTRSTQAILMLNSLVQAERVYKMATGAYTTDLTVLDIQVPEDTMAGSWTGSNSTYPLKYMYSCQVNDSGAFVGCAANAANADLPLFHRSTGDYWCIGGIYGKSAKAEDVCKALGGYKQKGERSASNGYYFMD